MKKSYLLKKRGNQSSLHKKRDSSHSFGMTNSAVISTEGRNLFYQEPLGYPDLLRRYKKSYLLKKSNFHTVFLSIGVFLLIGISSVVLADVVTLNNGDEIFGSISRANPEMVTILKDGQPREFSGSQVMKLEFESFRMIPGEMSPENVKDPLIKEFLAKPVTSDNFPEALRVFLLDEDTYDLKLDRNFLHTTHDTFVVLKESGRDAANRVFRYFPDIESFEIPFARSITPGKSGELFGLMGKSGSVTYLSDRTIADEADFVDTPLYSRRHSVKFALSEVNPNSVVDAQYNISRNKSDPLKPFFVEKLFRGWEPKKLVRLIIRVPKGMNLKYAVEENGTPIQVTSKEEDDSIVHTFEASNTTAILEEPLMPSTYRISSRVICALDDTWANIASRYWSLLSAKIKVAGEDPDLIALVKKVIEGKVEKEDQVRAIFSFVAKEIELLSINPGAFSHEPIDPGKVFSARQGTQMDKALLYHVLLKIAGIQNNLSLVSSVDSGKWRYDVPCLLQGSSLIVEIPGIAGVLGINAPVNQNLSPDVRVSFLQGSEGIKLPSGDPFLVPNVDRELECDTNRIDAEITADGTLRMAIKSSPTGNLSAGLRGLKSRQKEELSKIFQQVFHSEFPGARLLDFEFKNLDDLNQPVQGYFKVEVPDFALKSGNDLLVIPLPVTKSDYSAVNVGATVRRENLSWDRFYSTDTVITLKIPDGYIPHALPEGCFAQAEGMFYFSNFSYSVGTIKFQDRYGRSVRDLSADAYTKYKAFIEKMSETGNQWMIVRKR